MECGTGRDIYSDVVDTLTCMFGEVLSREVIFTIVESCDGDVNLAVEAVMSMSNDSTDNTTTTTATEQTETTFVNIPEETAYHQQPTNLSRDVNPKATVQPTISYAGASSNTGAVPKQAPKAPSQTMVWTDQLRQIISYHNQGSRILILMRGVPGSGKSYLAKQIIEMLIGVSYNDYKNHIFSTDDFFMVRGQYQYEKYRLSEAHDWNQNRVRHALRRGVSPVVVDNTNVEVWEMEPYLREAVRNGYIVEVVEPNTPWAKKANQLLRKSTHDVPITTIKRMLSNYVDGISGKFLIDYYGLSYPGDKVPPVMRNKPEYISPQIKVLPSSFTAQSDVVETRNVPHTNDLQVPQEQEPTITNPFKSNERIIPIEVRSEQEELAGQSRYCEIQKQLEEIEKVEKEWEHGEGWVAVSQETVGTADNAPAMLQPRPPRTISEASDQSNPKENMMNTVKKCDDWRKVSMFLPSWTNEPPPPVDENIELPVKETQSSATCVEFGDTNLRNPSKILKVISAYPRDINVFTIPNQKEKIPVIRMLDKSTVTNELLITETFRCKNEEQHFVAFRRLFKNIPRASLRDIFDKCCGDVNWAVDIVLGGMAANKINLSGGEDISDTEDEISKSEQCNCLAAYQIIPDSVIEPTNPMIDHRDIPSHSNETNILPQKKAKIAPSDSNLQLKREIESNFVIGDDYYSEHALKIRNYRHGIFNFPTPNTEDFPKHDLEQQPSTSTYATTEDMQTMNEAAALSDGEGSSSSSVGEVERTINIDMGFEFIAQLDNLFGRQGMVYPEKVKPKINIPISLLNELNAFWMESCMSQLDNHQKESDKMMKEDEEFARQLEMKEDELAQQGKEPEIPDLKEIMDMDFAISLYQKDVAEWKSKEPTDMAAKLTRDKLFNLFPDMSQDVLSELLMAHDNNFQATVEVLLMSTGNSQILEDKNGLNKFVMQKEMEKQERLLEEERKALSEVEWPLLPKGETVDQTTVDKYREEAEKHLQRRNMNYQKAQDYIRRGMTQVANYYSDVAAYHKKKFEQANSLAAVSQMQMHSKKLDNTTIDLHYLRVGEARESLDLFLDSHIQKLKEKQGSHSKVRQRSLHLITGRGLHSMGRPVVKPAVKRRLRERQLDWREGNPGMLTTVVTADSKLSYEVPELP